ncbi:type II toxin-antitoxin system VapC family toxin [Aetokthonos hydrillicola Thurmond2011]|jgi:PIN domain nuclease of toxin-antitoxin system|uniref:Type II toxin-antitoxin system VapC family toxin n=1 Tax=Aetokthonos hydrillicola Thurmond2011 TaxID=2712845 RepID=A0AAP5IBS9_9CYAN|nr:type II toxin-antitoxin system VapC family toxin [Aetokthonos hydrillicola]MBO3458805.1 type II toxin-antitoxin system VapC family toxin [Aetokthonos hydrillicola CCALA 1050]MBW4585551.1 type II toxin-antitoxin system VapC family toxin [Aetokthonos hydrillicola CCALA 1050]MDR9896175.1 type II toxin-antitoxin system VapC family toxin [Aetokthonos hydrillicola Thurmond2011]
MIILDTHIWIWWVANHPRLTEKYRNWIEEYQSKGLGVSIISCWEVAKLVEINKLTLSIPVDEWLAAALAYPGVQRLDLTIPIIVESTKLTGFHRDPSDQIIVATARIYGCPLLTMDAKILAYPDVQTLK